MPRNEFEFFYCSWRYSILPVLRRCQRYRQCKETYFVRVLLLEFNRCHGPLINDKSSVFCCLFLQRDKRSVEMFHTISLVSMIPATNALTVSMKPVKHALQIFTLFAIDFRNFYESFIKNYNVLSMYDIKNYSSFELL
jgi:hypothetical protein